MSLRIVIIFALLLMILSIANAESVSIPLHVIKKPANDLIDSSGNAIDAGVASSLAQKGQDLSFLNPVENKLWQNKNYSAEDLKAQAQFPKGTSGVQFLSTEAEIPFTYMARVSAANGQFYRLSLSRMAHVTLMRAALLRRLGYYVPTPKYYKDLRVFFNSEEEKESFLKTSQEAMISDFDSRGWVKENNKDNHSLVFSDAILEQATAEYYDSQWGFAPSPNVPEQLSSVLRLSRYRAYRALIIPFSLIDIPESINRFSPKFASILSGHIVINHPYAESFSAVTYEDIRWLLLRMQNWSANDIQEIVKAGKFPSDLEPVVIAKTLYRLNNAFELFNVPKNNLGKMPSLDINSASGIVKHGKVTQEFVPGYPQRFSHGDREEPFKDGDFERYLSIRLKSTAISTAASELSKKLQLLKVDTLYQKHLDDLKSQVITHIKTHPKEPFYKPVESWGGPIAGLNVDASRSISTGTYYGSSAPIQLIDNITASATLGYFMSIDGMPNVTPTAGGNVVVMRDYTHVRPLMSIEEGSKVSWKNLAVPLFMNKLAKILSNNQDPKNAYTKMILKLDNADSGSGTDTQNGSDSEKSKKDPVDEFLAELRDGEVFTITDSVALTSYLQMNSTFDVLMGISPLNFINSISGGVDASRVILRQTSFMRTSEGIQVFVRNQNAKVFGVTLDANYFINILNIRAQTSIADLHTDAFVIDYNPEYQDWIDKGKTDNSFVKDFINTKEALKPVLKTLFRNNDTEMLYSKFKYKKFAIDHKLNTKEIKNKFLWSRFGEFTEDHLLKIQYPLSEDNPDLKPEDEEVTLFSSKKGQLRGISPMSFLTDVINGWISKISPSVKPKIDFTEDPNPANHAEGKAVWRIITTDTDLTKNGDTYPNISVIQHVWGGWHLSRNKFLNLIDEVQKEYANTPLASYRLIEKEAFYSVSAVDFYRVTASLSILPEGLDKIKEMILQSDENGKSVPVSKFINRLFQKLSEVFGHKARPNDKGLFEEVVTLLGNGDYKKGLSVYNEQCREEKRQKNNGEEPLPQFTWLNGISYDCLSDWTQKLIHLSSKYPVNNKILQAKWMTEVLYILDEKIPLPQILKYVGEKNYIYVIRINGFRKGDEDGDLEFFSNTLGDPNDNFEYANGLVSMYANKTRISPIELDRSQAGFR